MVRPANARTVLGRFKIHTYQGWNVGKPLYGYEPEWHRHPVKAKAEEGATKHRLKPNPARGPVVTQIFVWRALERLSYDHMANRLNADLDRHPPPEPVKRATYNTAVGAWTATAVRDVLDNPKYTGYMVWNRRKRSRPERGVKGRVNPPSEWVWSPQPTHEPLVTRAMFDAASPRLARSYGSARALAPPRARTTATRKLPAVTCCGHTWRATCARAGCSARPGARRATTSPTTPASPTAKTTRPNPGTPTTRPTSWSTRNRSFP